jgi:hypothetical protein
MAGYLSKVTVKGHTYYRLVESYRENGKVKHRILENYGTTPPESVRATVRATPVSATIKRVSATHTITFTASQWTGIELRAKQKGMTTAEYLKWRIPDGDRPSHHGPKGILKRLY